MFRLNDAVEYAVRECIKEGILEDFLMENRAEVVAMSIFEFDEEREWKQNTTQDFQCEKRGKSVNNDFPSIHINIFLFITELSIFQNICSNTSIDTLPLLLF